MQPQVLENVGLNSNLLQGSRAMICNSVRDKPLVTMLVPSYNHERFVANTIRSIIDQDYHNLELIVIDDGSIDGSVPIIESLAPDCSKRFIRFEFVRRSNGGVASALNHAIRWGRGKYFSALASDDLILKNKTTKTVDILENYANVSAVCGASIEIDEDGFKIGKMATVNRLYGIDDVVLHNYVLSAPTLMIRYDKLRAIGDIPAHIVIEDWYIWIRLTEQGDKIMTTSDTLAYYRRHGFNFSNNYERLLRARLDVLEYAKDHPSYRKSSARVYLMSAVDYSAVEKRRAVGYVLSALRLYKKCALSWQFRYALLRIMIPSSLLRFLRSSRSFFRRVSKTA
jgi:alpha-1,3-rhamnosyltransferase